MASLFYSTLFALFLLQTASPLKTFFKSAQHIQVKVLFKELSASLKMLPLPTLTPLFPLLSKLNTPSSSLRISFV
uniref:Uncharacterized protein n=1 Tax=Pristionchus pacificus TaxID=54126 RepID=A0A2A6B8P7_PRIPA|eukprot:PDM62260.1 hypothetical protein PRIPAC_51702 [Pristionchus pacificus]